MVFFWISFVIPPVFPFVKMKGILGGGFKWGQFHDSLPVSLSPVARTTVTCCLDDGDPLPLQRQPVWKQCECYKHWERGNVTHVCPVVDSTVMSHFQNEAVLFGLREREE